MRVIVAAVKGVFAVAVSLLFLDDVKAGPVEVEADAGVITMVATVEAIDVTNRVVTVVGPNNNWVEVIVGPELVAGSTRLKAGTAQKIVLNTISTLAMVRIGKTYGNHMVDVRATNEKLRARAVRTVMGVADVDPPLARRALADTEWEVKPAILMCMRGLTADAATRALSDADGRLRDALDRTSGAA